MEKFLNSSLNSYKILIYRIITSILLGIIAFYSVFNGGMVLLITIMVIVTALNYEWHKITEKKSNSLFLIFKVLLFLISFILVYKHINFIFILSYLAFLSVIFSFIYKPKQNYFYLLFGPLYICLPILLLYKIRLEFELGLEVAIWCLFVTWSTDIFSYLGGNIFKGPKLLKTISPNKTWSGFITGILASIIISYILITCFDMSVGHSFIISFFLSLSVQLGDLFESYVKRVHGFKDSGKILPGHGGALDRMDGFLFCSLAISLGVYFYAY